MKIKDQGDRINLSADLYILSFHCIVGTDILVTDQLIVLYLVGQQFL